MKFEEWWDANKAGCEGRSPQIVAALAWEAGKDELVRRIRVDLTRDRAASKRKKNMAPSETPLGASLGAESNEPCELLEAPTGGDGGVRGGEEKSVRREGGGVEGERGFRMAPYLAIWKDKFGGFFPAARFATSFRMLEVEYGQPELIEAFRRYCSRERSNFASPFAFCQKVKVWMDVESRDMTKDKW